MKRKYLNSEESELRISERGEAARTLEERRMELTREAELIMREIERKTGKRGLSARSRAVGYAPNDYGFSKKYKKS